MLQKDDKSNNDFEEKAIDYFFRTRMRMRIRTGTKTRIWIRIRIGIRI
jgi:hypothetical protein